MTDSELVEALINETPQRITKVGEPTLSDLVEGRRIDAEIKKTYPDSRLAYKTYDDIADDEIYDPFDFATVGNKVRSNIVDAITERFPVTKGNYTLAIENLKYENPKNRTLSEEKEVMKSEASLTDRLKGDWVLYDNTTGKEIQRVNKTLLNVPRMTERGTFIRNGSEYGLKHMFRLRPGLYARTKQDGTPSVHINPAQTTGRQMSINMDQASGVMTIKRETRTYGVLPMLRAAGVPDDAIKASWGEEVFNMNKNKYARLLANPDGKQFKEYQDLWIKDFLPIKLDPETTLSTTGKPYESMNADALLTASNKVLKLSRSGSVEGEDDRDSLQYQRIMGPADYIPERIVRDGGGLIRKLVQEVMRSGSLDKIEAGALQPHVDSVFLEDRHAGYIDGASPFEALDLASNVSRIGEGGIGDTKAAPAETRGVNDSYLGFIDPVRSPESTKVGLEVYMSYGVKKDSKGNLYANFIDKTGKKALRPMGLVSSSYVATPEYYNPDADPEEFIPVFAKGKGIEYIQRKDVDFYLASSNNMMSIGAGMIPAIGGIRSNRTLMGCLHPETPVLIVRDDKELIMSAEQLLNEFKEGDSVISLSDDMGLAKIRPIRQVVKSNASDYYEIAVNELIKVKVTGNHKWYDLKTKKLITTSDITEEGIDIPFYWGLAEGVVTAEVVAVKLEDTTYDYSIDIDVDDNLYMLANGMFTHNSKYPLQALPLKHREAPLVQRGMQLDDGSESTTEKYVSKQLGAKYAPISGKVTYVDDDEIVIKGIDGQRHTVSLYNNYPANQKGFLHNTATVKVGDRVSEKQCIAASNYTDDSGTAALGTNLKVAFMTGRGAGAFEDATYISESCAKKLASEQLYKFRGDMSSETGYGKEKFINLFGQQDYTAEQLAKIDDNGFPKEGTVFHKGDPVFLGYQIRDLSTSGLSRTASVPYVKTWEHEVPGTVIDVVKGRKHMTVYTKSYAPAVPGDKLCFDDKTEIMTKRGWIFIKDLLQDDKVLTLDINTGKNYFTEFDAAFRYGCENELLYHLTTKRLDIFVTKDHKHPVAAMNNARYIMFQSSEQIFGKQRYFLTGCNLQSASNYACSRDEKAKERWEKYTGSVYCVMVPDTHTVYVRRNGKTVWSGNSGRYGNKAEISMVVPDDKMPRSVDGTPFDIIASPLSLPSRLNTSMLAEAQLSKIAKATGKPYTLPDFMEETLPDFVDRELKKYGMQSTEDVYDPETGKTIPGVESGYMFYYKLKHTAEYKERGRATGTYSSEEVPLKGEGAARRLGMMETSAVYSGGGMDVLRDAKLIRGQRNDEFWRDYRDGKTPDVPTTPLVHKKFFAHLVGSGAKITQPESGTFRLSTATDADIKELTGKREVRQAATFNSKNMQPIDGGLFDPQIFGADGDRWGYFQLPEPILNPLMFKPIAGVLGWTDTELREYLQGQRKIDNEFGSEALMRKLDSIDLKKELNSAKNVLKAQGTTLQQRDLARKRIRAISPMIKQGTKPSDYFFTRMPILPPRYRTVTTINGGETNIAADANFLYKRMIDAALDLGAAKSKLPGEFQVDARNSLYNSVNALVGLQPTDDPKLEAKGVSGLLKWAFGKGSPKQSASHRKIFGSNLDLGGLGVIIPDSRLTIDQVGIPEESAWKMFEPFVVRELKGRGFSTLQAMKQVLERSPEAKQELINVMKDRPILLNRAPTLWRYGIQGQMPVLVEGSAIRINPNICASMGADFDGNCCDFDSKIFVKISKSALEKLNDTNYIISNAPRTNKEDKMSVTSNSVVSVKNEGLKMMSIGLFPKYGTPIKDKNGADVYGLPSGIEVLTTDPVTGKVSYAKATSFTEEKNCECVEVVAGGRSVVVSSNATLAVFEPSEGRLIKVEAAEHQNRLIPVLKQMPLAFGDNYDRDFGWWIGSLISDGWITDRMVGYSKLEDIKRKEFVRIARTICENFNATEYKASKSDPNKLGDATKVHLTGTDLAMKCREFGVYSDELVDGKSALRKQIPYDMIINGSEEFLWGLLSGLLDGDGSMAMNTSTKNVRFSCRYATSSKELRESFEFLLYRLGIRFSTTVTPPRNWSNEAYTICPSTVDMYYNLDKLSCIGAREIELLTEWKKHAPSKDDRDIIPIADAELAVLRANKLNQISNTMYTALNKSKRVTRAVAMKHIEYLKDLAPEFTERILNSNTHWVTVSSVKSVGKRDVYDFAIPDTKVFVVNTGVTIYDSMSTHVPVSNEAVRAIKENMMPSKNLLSPKNFKAHFVPKDAANEGLYLASRIGAGDPIRFRTEEEAQEAFRKGEIKIDTPIIIG